MIFAQLERVEEYWVYRGKVEALMHGKYSQMSVAFPLNVINRVINKLLFL